MSNSTGTITIGDVEYRLAIKDYAQRNRYRYGVVAGSVRLRDEAIAAYSRKSVRRAEILTEIDQDAFYAAMES